MKIIRIMFCLTGCAILATCSYSRNADGSSAYTGGVSYDLLPYTLPPTTGYSK